MANIIPIDTSPLELEEMDDGGAVAAHPSKDDREHVEVELLLAGIRSRYGYDFTRYSRGSLIRRLERAKEQAHVSRYTELLDVLFHDPRSFDEFLKQMSVTVTEMFRNPLFYAGVRESIVPLFKTFPFLKIWCAGCATGEEAYSLAIVLHEHGLLERTRIYATDVNKHSLDIAEKGIYPMRHIDSYARNYSESGGARDFAEYYSDSYSYAKMKDFLKDHITFSYHNLVTDGVFGEMNLICCRNVLIYFGRALQDHALQLFSDSLRHGGFLCLGDKETLHFTAVKPMFEPVDTRQKIYRKRGTPDPNSMEDSNPW